MILLIDNIRGPDQATSDEPESNLSLSVDDSDIKKKRKKVSTTSLQRTFFYVWIMVYEKVAFMNGAPPGEVINPTTARVSDFLCL